MKREITKKYSKWNLGASVESIDIEPDEKLMVNIADIVAKKYHDQTGHDVCIVTVTMDVQLGALMPKAKDTLEVVR